MFRQATGLKPVEIPHKYTLEKGLFFVEGLDFPSLTGYLSCMNYWKEKTVLITGGSSGIGRVLADRFASVDARVAIVGIEPEGVKKAVDEINESGGEALGLTADITKDEDVQSMIQTTIDRFGRLDVLVNNAGRSMRGAVKDTTPDQFRELMELNFIALVRVTLAALPHLLKQRGHIVNMGSLAAKTASRWVGAYPATKHAVAAYSQQLRLEHKEDGLHVLLVCPGPIARNGKRLYRLEGEEKVPEQARGPAGGAKLPKINPNHLARSILQACQHRREELIVPRHTRLLFVLSQIWPWLGDWLVLRNT